MLLGADWCCGGVTGALVLPMDINWGNWCCRGAASGEDGTVQGPDSAVGVLGVIGA